MNLTKELIMNSHERTEMLFERAKNAGLESPTEAMISESIADAEFDALTDPVRVATENHGWADGGLFIDAVRKAVGTLAEHAARDLDHYGKIHKEWYKAVKRVRKLVALS